jgi:hypothetical protein
MLCGGSILALVGAVGVPGSARAFYFDEQRNFSFRARLYTEVSIATQDNEPQTATRQKGGDVVSHRTFFNPEFDAKLTPYASLLGLDDLSFRCALWGFYDGVYDYLPGQWNAARQNLRARFSRGRTSSAPFFPRDDQRIDIKKVYSYQADPTLGEDHQPGDVADLPFRINEAYLNLTKGRVSFRVGRQTISWGESDTIALLDQSNPFDVTRAIPGLFEDIDEARIPLWTLRSTVRLFDVWGPFTSAFLDAYLVPGSIDTATSIVPIPGGVSPYSPPETDPQAFASAFTAFVPPELQPLMNGFLGGIQFVQYDHMPARTMSNSRYGVRLESIINRDYTASLWFYRTIAQVAVPRFKPLDLVGTPEPGFPEPDPLKPPCQDGHCTQIITETVHGLTTVFGASLSFYSALLNGVVRLNTQYFLDEPAFIPSENVPFQNLLRHPAFRSLLEPLGIKVPKGPIQGFVPRADFFRWEIGFDRFFFNRVLNPTNSFAWVTALVGSWNLSETFTDKDYRFYGQRKLARDGLKVGVNTGELEALEDVTKLRTVDEDFVDLHEVEWFIQSSLQTNYFHGRMTPQMTVILNPRGTFVFAPSVQFRYSDRILFDLKYVLLEGGFFDTGFFRDRDQIAARLTFLLN